MRAKEFITEIGFLKGLATVASIANKVVPTYLGDNGVNLDVASAMTSNAQVASDAKKLAIQTAPKVYKAWLQYALEKDDVAPAVTRPDRPPNTTPNRSDLPLTPTGANLSDSKSYQGKHKLKEGQINLGNPNMFLTWIQDYIKTPQTADLTLADLPDLTNKAKVIEFLETQITQYNLKRKKAQTVGRAIWKATGARGEGTLTATSGNKYTAQKDPDSNSIVWMDVNKNVVDIKRSDLLDQLRDQLLTQSLTGGTEL